MLFVGRLGCLKYQNFAVSSGFKTNEPQNRVAEEDLGEAFLPTDEVILTSRTPLPLHVQLEARLSALFF